MVGHSQKWFTLFSYRICSSSDLSESIQHAHAHTQRRQVEGTSCVVTRCCCVWKCQPSQATLKSGAIFKVLISRKENVREIESHFLSSLPAWWATKLRVIKVENNCTWRHLTINKCLHTPTQSNKRYPTPPWNLMASFFKVTKALNDIHVQDTVYAISVSRLNLTRFTTGSKQIVNGHAQPKVGLCRKSPS